MCHFIWRRKHGRASIPISVFLQMVPCALLFNSNYPYLIIWFHAEETSYLSVEFPLVPYCFHGQWISVHPYMFSKKCWKERITCSLICSNRANSSRTSRMGLLWVVPVMGFPGCTVGSGASEAHLILSPFTVLWFALYFVNFIPFGWNKTKIASNRHSIHKTKLELVQNSVTSQYTICIMWLPGHQHKFFAPIELYYLLSQM